MNGDRKVEQKAELHRMTLDVLHEIAPESRTVEIEPRINFREQFDFDSLDFMRFALALKERCGVEIPEVDYPKLSSLDGCVAYLTTRLAAAEQV